MSDTLFDDFMEKEDNKSRIDDTANDTTHEDDISIDDMDDIINDVDETSSNYSFAKEVIKQEGSHWLPEEFAPFAKMVITDRAFVDSDGQKPVNRRILWTMFQSKATSNDKHVKAAKIVGNTMGSYHPHGDSAISEALARMAQGFVNRVPLVDAEGSVGEVTGDKAAAPRYWECRLTPAGMELLSEVNAGAAIMIDSYDGESKIPQTLPARWPALLVNGTVGIGVGYAANIPPHNPTEVMNASIAYIRNPEIDVDEILSIAPGPDFPDGGIIEGIDGIKEYYETGRGKFSVKARYDIEYPKKGLPKIIFTDIPYGVSAEAVKTKVQSLIDPKTTSGKKAPKPNDILAKGVSSIDDRSDKNTKGIMIECKVNVGVNPKDVVRELFEKTPLKTSISVNSNVLVNGRIATASFMDLIKIFVDTRRVATRRKMTTRLDKIDEKVHQLEGILLALVDLDKVIKIIRSSESQSVAKSELMDKMKMSETQAEYVMSLQLRRLTKSDATAIENEKKELDKEIEYINNVLNTPSLLDENIIEELKKTKKVIASERRSEILNITSEDMKEKQKFAAQQRRMSSKNMDCYITMFSNGSFIKTYEPFTYVDPNTEMLKKSLDHTPIVEQIKVKTKEDIIIITDSGSGHRVPVSYIPEDAAVGIYAIGISDLKDGEKAVGMAKDKTTSKDIGLAIATSHGGIKITKTGDYPAKDSFPVIGSMDEDEKIVSTKWLGTRKDWQFTMVSSSGNILLFDSSAVRPSGSKAGSVKGMKLKDSNDRVIYFNIVDPTKTVNGQNVLITLSNSTIKMTSLEEISPKGRGGMGVATQGFRKGEGDLVNAYVGDSPAICGTSETRPCIPNPMIKVRTNAGDYFGMPAYLGASSITAK